MPGRRYPTRRRGAPATRMLEWAGLTELAFTNTAASVLRVVTLLDTSTELQKMTFYRAVGNIHCMPQADVDTIIHYGIFKANRQTGGAQIQLNPSMDEEQEHWLWWGMRTVLFRATSPTGGDACTNISFDVKVKRIVSVGEAILLAIVASNAYQSNISARILSKLTGTR